MKSKKWLFTILLSASVALSACGSEEDQSVSTGEKESTDESATLSIAEGAEQMKTEIVDLKEQLNAEDQTKVKENAENLEELWEAFEDDVKDQDAELYEKVETPLHLIEAGAEVEPLDVSTLTQAADDLNDVLTELENLK
ncbi:MAG: hypothetical protein R3267_11300 [Paenisporosarcina sp.]|nr:hypothetical protein [Paenisporosarcina sp.]